MKRLAMLACCLICILSTSMSVYASDSYGKIEAKEKQVASEKLYALYEQDRVERVDYYNPETGEFFVWLKDNTDTMLRSNFRTVHNFSFYIRHNVSSKPFRINSKYIKVTSNGHLRDAYNNVLNSRFPYIVDVTSGFLDLARFSFTTYGNEEGYDQVKGYRDYTVTVSTGDDTDRYGAGPTLEGYGTVYEDR